MYNGEYQNDMKNGTGKYIFQNGSIYEGLWKNNKRVGKGKLDL